MVVEELETGLFLDLPLQEYITRFTVTDIREFLVVDELHGDENLKFFSLLSYKVTPIKHKTLFNPPLQHSHNGTDSTNTGTGSDVIIPIPGTVQYRLSFYNYKGYTFVKIKNVTTNVESYAFKKKELDFWNPVLYKIKKDFYN